MFWQTKRGVNCEIDTQDYAEGFRSDGSSTTCYVTIPWAQREDFVKDMMGYYYRIAAGGLVGRELPESCPAVSWPVTNAGKQYCTNCELVRVLGPYDDQPATGTITDATNANPIVVTTSSAHGLTDTIYNSTIATELESYGYPVSRGTVTIASVGGNTAANGTHRFKVLSSTTFSLLGVTGNGAYTTGGTFSSTSYATKTTQGWPSFAKARYKCTFQTLPYVIQAQDAINAETDERKRYVYRRRKINSREMKIPGGGFKFFGTSDKFFEVGFRVSTEVEYQYTWYAVPVDCVPYTYILDYVGHVNQASWRDNNVPSHNDYAAQTMLLKGADERTYFDANGVMLADVTYMFGYRGMTWNYFPNRLGVFAKIVDETNGLTLYPDVIDGPSPAGGTRGVISINAAGNVDFTNLFKSA